MKTLLITICLSFQVIQCTWYSDQCIGIDTIWPAYTPSVLINQLTNDKRKNLNLYDNVAKTNLFLLTQSYSKKDAWSQANEYCQKVKDLDFVQYPYSLKCIGCVWRISSVVKIEFHSVGFLEEYALPLKKKWIKSGFYNPAKFLSDLTLQLISVFQEGFFYKSFKVENIGLTHHPDYNKRRFSLMNVKNIRRICKKEYFTFTEKFSIKLVVHDKFFTNLTPASCMILNLYHLMVAFDILKTNLLDQMDKQLKKMDINKKERYELVQKQNQLILTSMVDQRNQILSFIMVNQFVTSGGLVSKLDDLKNYLISSNSELANQIGLVGALSNLDWMNGEVLEELTGLQGLILPSRQTVIDNLGALDTEVNDVLVNHIDQVEFGMNNLRQSVLFASDAFDINLDKVDQIIEFAQVNIASKKVGKNTSIGEFDESMMSEEKGIIDVRNMVMKSNVDVMQKDHRLLPKLEQVQRDFKSNKDDTMVRTMANLARKTIFDITDPSYEENIEVTHDFTNLFIQVKKNFKENIINRVLI